MQPNPQLLLRFHWAALAVWTLLLLPTILWWRESIVWIVAMSWYANWVGHFSAVQAARTEVRQDDGGG